MRKLAAAIGFSAAVWAGAACAQDARSTDFSITTGADYSSGDYGTGINTDILVVPLTARLKTGNFRVSATLPYIRIDGANIVGGEGGPIVVDPNAPRVKREGMGDLTLGANYAIPESRLGFGLDLGTRVKLPTAQSGLGTGKTDVAVSGELSKTLGKVTPFVQAGYRWMGQPAGIHLNNVWYGSAGASVVLGKSVLLASYDYRQATTSLVKNSQDIFAAFSTPFSRRLNFTVYGSGGLSKGAPDYGAGAMITLKAF